MNKNIKFKMNKVLQGLLFLQGQDLAYPFQVASIYNSEPDMEWHKKIQEKWKNVLSEFKETIKENAKFWWSEQKIRRIAFKIKKRISPTKR